jgi:hypothetical protein
MVGRVGIARGFCLTYYCTDCTVAKMSKVVHKGSEEARNELPTLIEAAESGRTTVITRRGRPVAALEGTGRGLWGKNSRRALVRLRDEWNR